MRPGDQQLVLDGPPEAAGELDQGRGRRGPPLPPDPFPGLGLGLLDRPGRADAPGAELGVRVRVARESCSTASSSYRPSEARRTRTRQARSTSSSAASSRSSKCSGGVAAHASVCSAAVRWSGSSARAAATLGHPGQPPGDQHGRAPLLGGPQRQREERLDHARRSARSARTTSDAVEEVAGGQLALGQHVPGRADGERPVDRLRQPRRIGQQHLERRLVGAHRGEGQVTGVEQVQVGVGQVGEVRRGAGGLDRGGRRPARARRRSAARRSRFGARARRGSPPSGLVASSVVADQADRVGAGAVQPALRSTPSGRGRPPSPTARIRSSSSVLPQAWSAEVGAQPLDERLLADVGHQLLQDAPGPCSR